MKLLEKRLKKKRNLAMSSNPANGQENDPSYQELDVSQFSKVDNYQALRLGSPTRGNFEKECKVDPDNEVPAPGKVEGNEEYGQSTNI